jgi:hypothetical protein
VNDKNTLKLIQSFPRIFPKPFHFDVSDGWFNLIFKLCKDIDAECLKLGIPSDRWVTASQIKQKYGQLCFSYGDTGKVDDFIYDAMDLSARICEDCGLLGRERDDGWIHTMCDVCHNQYTKAKKAK